MLSTEIQLDKLNACPVCDSTALRYQPSPKYWIEREHFNAVKEQLGLSKCRDCRLMITNPRPSLNLLTSFYNKPGYQCHELHFDSSQGSDATARFNIIEKVCDKGLFLDFGCGSGNMLLAAKNRGWSRVFGVELGDTARTRLLSEGWQVYADLNSASSVRGEVDVVTMIQVLEHLFDLPAALREVWEVLRPGGLFVVEVPNAGSLRARIAGSKLAKLFSRPIQRYQAYPIHLYHFEAPQIARLLKRHGFIIEEIHTLGVGVEELFAPPAPRPTTWPPLKSNSEPVTRAKASRVMPGPVKRSVKLAMSRFRLGEELFVICRKPKAGRN